MLFYWALFAVPSVVSLSPVRLERYSRLAIVGLTAVALVILIGLRDQVGADWPGYLNILNGYQTLTFWDALSGREPGFALINWLSIQFDWGIYGVNVACAVILVAGLSAFLLRQPNFWRGLALAIPVLVIQLGMSGIRQAAAIGFLFFALNAFVDRKLVRYLAFVFLAFTLHQTAIVFGLLAIFIRGRIRLLPAVGAGLLVVLVALFLFKDPDFYRNAYIQQDLGGAAGAMPRAAFNVTAALLFWRYSKPWAEQYPEDHRLFGIMAIAVVIITPFVPFAQVAVDRLEYYLIPFQIAVVARVPEFLPQRMRLTFTTIVLAGYAAALAIWMNFSWIAQSGWMPYRSLLFEQG
jgi:hypothetical protein